MSEPKVTARPDDRHIRSAAGRRSARAASASATRDGLAPRAAAGGGIAAGGPSLSFSLGRIPVLPPALAQTMPPLQRVPVNGDGDKLSAKKDPDDRDAGSHREATGGGAHLIFRSGAGAGTDIGPVRILGQGLEAEVYAAGDTVYKVSKYSHEDFVARFNAEYKALSRMNEHTPGIVPKVKAFGEAQVMMGQNVGHVVGKEGKGSFYPAFSMEKINAVPSVHGHARLSQDEWDAFASDFKRFVAALIATDSTWDLSARNYLRTESEGFRFFDVKPAVNDDERIADVDEYVRKGKEQLVMKDPRRGSEEQEEDLFPPAPSLPSRPPSEITGSLSRTRVSHSLLKDLTTASPPPRQGRRSSKPPLPLKREETISPYPVSHPQPASSGAARALWLEEEEPKKSQAVQSGSVHAPWLSEE